MTEGLPAARPWRLSVERKIQVGFGAALALLVAVGAAALRSTGGTVESAGWVSQTIEVEATLQETLRNLIDAETGARGFALTGRDAFLESYASARANMGGLISRLRALTADNPSQQRRVAALDSLVGVRFERMAELIATRRRLGLQAAARQATTGGGKQVMDRIRGVIVAMDSTEQQLLGRRQAALQAAARLARRMVWLGTALAVVVALVFGVLIGRDLAGRRRAEQAFKESERRLFQILEAMPIGVFVVDAAGRPYYANRASQELLGKGIVPAATAEQLSEVYQVYVAGTGELYPPQRLPVVRALQGERVAVVDIEIHHPDRIVPLEVWASPVRDSDGRVAFAVAAFSDITERKRAEDRVRRVVESAPNAMVLVNQHGTITLVNAQTEQSFGYSRDELVGQPVEILVPARFRAHHPAHRDGFFANPSVRAMGTGRDLHGLRKDGQEFPVEIGLSPIQTEEGPLVLASIVDITERKRARADIDRLNAELSGRVAELQVLNRELEAFSYSVSHDLRAPLRSIDGFSKILLEDYAPQLDATAHDSLRRIRAATQRMAELIDDMLSLARVSRAELKREVVDLSALARAIADNLRRAEPERQVDVVIADGLVTEGDGRLLRAVLENLLGNAWKFSRQRPRARIEVGVQSGGDGGRAYYVRDDGAGFDMAYVGKLFGVFQRLHGMTEFEGTGVGLATVQRIVHRHGGRVWAEGAVDRGATFYFTLSSDKEPHGEADAAARRG